MVQERNTYLVGGAVRDHLLGIESKDNDYVVVGATPDQMIAEGFSMVGADFPVFLHPETGEEYALARTERKTGVGYNGFSTDHSPTITLREDLERRDLTVNAMAMTEDFRVIDYFGGISDLEKGIIRHVGPAFMEDPVRVLRAARFAARYNWDLASETFDLMLRMVKSGELDHLTKERVYKEFEKGFKEPFPDKMMYVLRLVGFFGIREYKGLAPRPTDVSNPSKSWQSKMVAVFYESTDLKGRGFPTEIVEAVEIVQRIRPYVIFYTVFGSEDRFRKVIELGDALRRTNQFMIALDALEMIESQSYVKVRRDVHLLKSARFGHLIPKDLKGPEIKNFVDEQKIKFLENSRS